MADDAAIGPRRYKRPDAPRRPTGVQVARTNDSRHADWNAPTFLPFSGYVNSTEARMSANIPRSDDIATDETHNLISADKVTGTNVYNRQGEKLGSVHDIMLNKSSGQVAYAIMSFGGFLGMGESYHPLPWRALTYDTRQAGYMVDIDRQRLEGAPHYSSANEPNWSDRAYGQGVDRYYGY
jgi:hypothetical protein